MDTNLAIIDAVNELEVACLEQEQVSCPVYHHFSPGVYMREVHIPSGTFSIGHRQKTKHLNIFLKGKVNFANEDGSVSLLEAPMVFTSNPGRKVGHILEDMVWLNVYATEETDIEKLEATYLDKSEAWESTQTKALGRMADREDFNSLLNEYGFTEKIVREQSENESDQIPFPDGIYSVAVFDSNIEGKGLFATADIKAGDFIAPARIDGKRTPAGRYTNHAKDCNAIMEKQDNIINLMAIKDVCGCKGGQAGEEITIDYRNSLELKGLKPCQV